MLDMYLAYGKVVNPDRESVNGKVFSEFEYLTLDYYDYQPDFSSGNEDEIGFKVNIRASFERPIT